MKALTAEEKYMLLEKAREARSRSYSPYSHYAVGAALLTEDGMQYGKCLLHAYRLCRTYGLF